LEAPDHGDGEEGEDQVGCDVDGRVEDADVSEDGFVVAFCGAGAWVRDWWGKEGLVRGDLPVWWTLAEVISSAHRCALEYDGECGDNGKYSDEYCAL